MEGEVPTQFCSRLSDWNYEAGILSYQGRIYIPDKEDLRLDLVKKFHDHYTAVMSLASWYDSIPFHFRILVFPLRR